MTYLAFTTALSALMSAQRGAPVGSPAYLAAGQAILALTQTYYRKVAV